MTVRRSRRRRILLRLERGLVLLAVALLAVALFALATRRAAAVPGGATGQGIPDVAEAWQAGRGDATCVCLVPGAVPSPTLEHSRLTAIFALLRRDRLIAGPLLDQSADLGVCACLDAYERGCDGAFDVEHAVIVLDADLDDGLLAAILVHELRHMNRAAAGFTVDLAYGVTAARTLTCASEADAQAMATWFAWRLREAGDPRPLEALRAHPHYGDIARAFEAAIALGADEPLAARAAFARWYESDWRVRTYRFGASLAYMDRLDEDHAVVSYAPLPPDYFVGFDRLPGRSDVYRARPLTIE